MHNDNNKKRESTEKEIFLFFTGVQLSPTKQSNKGYLTSLTLHYYRLRKPFVEEAHMNVFSWEIKKNFERSSGEKFLPR